MKTRLKTIDETKLIRSIISSEKKRLKKGEKRQISMEEWNAHLKAANLAKKRNKKEESLYKQEQKIREMKGKKGCKKAQLKYTKIAKDHQKLMVQTDKAIDAWQIHINNRMRQEQAAYKLQTESQRFVLKRMAK